MRRKYLFSMKNDIIYVFDILLMAIYNEIRRRKEDGRGKRYIRGIYQNLIDAGCDQQMTELCMTFVKEGQFSDIAPVLTRHRSWLPVALSV